VSDYQQRLSLGAGALEQLSPRAHGSILSGEQSTRVRKNNAERKSPLVRPEKEQSERIAALKQKQHAHIERQLKDIRRMVNTPEFVSSYYQTVPGTSFAKVYNITVYN